MIHYDKLVDDNNDHILPPCVLHIEQKKHLDGICVFVYYKGNIVFLNWER